VREAVAELEKGTRICWWWATPSRFVFPKELMRYTQRTRIGEGRIKVNFLVNYGWNWDLNHSLENGDASTRHNVADASPSADISRIDLIVRWGGGRRSVVFLPIQSVYADFYVVDELCEFFT